MTQFEQDELWEATVRAYGFEFAQAADRRFSWKIEQRDGFARAWQVAVRLTEERQRFYDHGTGAVPLRK